MAGQMLWLADPTETGQICAQGVEVRSAERPDYELLVFRPPPGSSCGRVRERLRQASTHLSSACEARKTQALRTDASPFALYHLPHRQDLEVVADWLFAIRA
jgi:hypothetical protein